jgi:hypothetical protein
MKQRVTILGTLTSWIVLQPSGAFEAVARSASGPVQRGHLEFKSLLPFSLNSPNTHETTSARHDKIDHSTKRPATPRSASSAMRLLLSASVATHDWTTALAATEELAFGGYVCAQALRLFNDMSALSTDLKECHATSFNTDLTILLQRIMSIGTFQFLMHQIHFEGNWIFESVMLQMAVSEVFRSLRAQYAPSESKAGSKENNENLTAHWGIRKLQPQM